MEATAPHLPSCVFGGFCLIHWVIKNSGSHQDSRVIKTGPFSYQPGDGHVNSPT